MNIKVDNSSSILIEGRETIIYGIVFICVKDKYGQLRYERK